VRLWIAAVGRARSGPLNQLFEDYAARIAWPLALREVEVRQRLTGPALLRREAELLLAAVPSSARLVALDERGAAMSSDAFATRLAAWRDGGVGDVAFLIGGADGLDETVRHRADLVLALGAMTWPHLLVRALIAEQIYRSQQILAGHPYHRR
jgi:23S rRNA (pseudouridine1915-N3)-methyltransferase